MAAIGEKRLRNDEAADPQSSVMAPLGPRVKLQGAAVPPLMMPLFGIGTFRCKGASCTKAVEYALKSGVRLVDTAGGYKNEAAVKLGMDRSGVPRSELFVVSKVSRDDMDAKKAAAAIKRSCEALGREPIDLMLIHWPGTGNSNTASPLHRRARAAVWGELEAALTNGLVRAIGVSNFTVEHLKHLKEDGAKVTPAVNQVEVHPYLKQETLRSYCQSIGTQVQAYTSLGRCVDPPRMLYGRREPDHPRLVKNETVLRIAAQHDVAATTLLLRWATQQGMGTIPKACSPEHFDENVKRLFDDSWRISDAEMAELAQIESSLVEPFAYAYPLVKVPA